MRLEAKRCWKWEAACVRWLFLWTTAKAGTARSRSAGSTGSCRLGLARNEYIEVDSIPSRLYLASRMLVELGKRAAH